MSATDLLSFLLVCSVALTVLLWSRIPRPRGSLFNRAGWLFVAAFVLELSGFITRFYCWNNTPMYNAFQLYEFIIVLVLIATAEPSLKRTAWVLAVLGIAVFIAALMRQGGWAVLATDAILVFSTVLSIVLMRVLYLQAMHSDIAIHKLPAFWLFMGCLVYFGGLVPTMGGIRLLYVIDPVMSAQLWMVVPILAIVRYALAAWACYLVGRSV